MHYKINRQGFWERATCYLQALMPWRKVQESRGIDATVLEVHPDRDLLYLEAGREALRVIPCPPKYEHPRKGDRVKLELRLELETR